MPNDSDRRVKITAHFSWSWRSNCRLMVRSSIGTGAWCHNYCRGYHTERGTHFRGLVGEADSESGSDRFPGGASRLNRLTYRQVECRTRKWEDQAMTLGTMMPGV